MTQPSQQRHHGDPTPSIAASTNTTTMQPGYSTSRSAAMAPPAEGDVAATMERKGERARAQAGEHTGPVGSARGPGDPAIGEEKDLTSEMSRKEREHEEVLGDRERQAGSRIVRGAGRESEEVAALTERAREETLNRNRELDVAGAVKEGTGNKVTGE